MSSDLIKYMTGLKTAGVIPNTTRLTTNSSVGSSRPPKECTTTSGVLSTTFTTVKMREDSMVYLDVVLFTLSFSGFPDSLLYCEPTSPDSKVFPFLRSPNRVISTAPTVPISITPTTAGTTTLHAPTTQQVMYPGSRVKLVKARGTSEMVRATPAPAAKTQQRTRGSGRRPNVSRARVEGRRRSRV